MFFSAKTYEKRLKNHHNSYLYLRSAMPSAAVNLRTQLLMFHLLPATFILNGHLTADERRYTQRALTTRLPASLTQKARSAK